MQINSSIKKSENRKLTQHYNRLGLIIGFTLSTEIKFQFYFANVDIFENVSFWFYVCVFYEARVSENLGKKRTFFMNNA